MILIQETLPRKRPVTELYPRTRTQPLRSAAPGVDAAQPFVESLVAGTPIPPAPVSYDKEGTMNPLESVTTLRAVAEAFRDEKIIEYLTR